MATRWIYSGDQKGCTLLNRFALKQVDILRHQMGFQGLFQGQRRVNFDNGAAIVVQTVGTLNTIQVFVPPGVVGGEEALDAVIVSECWCTCCLAIGTITEVIGTLHNFGDCGNSEGTYPDDCVTNDEAIKNYNGIRYRADICRQITYNPDTNEYDYGTQEYICTPSDFAEYAVDDQVICLFRGSWSLNGDVYELSAPTCYPGCQGTSCTDACQAEPRPNQAGDEPDGTFMILPLEIAGANA